MTRILSFSILLSCSLAVSGCGGPVEPARYHLSGRITANGAPVPAGTIYIDPKDGGVQGFANIKNGQYDTRDGGKGHGGGPAVLRVAAYDGVAANELPLGKPLFPEINLVVDLAKADATKDIETSKETALPAATPDSSVVP